MTTSAHSAPPRAPLWGAVDRLLDQAPADAVDLMDQRVHLLFARRLRDRGVSVPELLAHEARLAALRSVTVPVVLERVREALDGPLILLKGAEVAAWYEDPSLRPFKDLDLLVPDAETAQAALVAHGFEPVGNPDLYVDIHHERPLWLPGQPLLVELHRAPKWPDELEAPRASELFDLCVPAHVPTAGISTLPPAAHILILAAHSWSHEPLRRLIELIDVAALLEGASRDDVDALARRWRIGRLASTTIAAADALFSDPPRRTLPLRLWARNLPAVRSRTVLESHLERWLAGYWGLPFREALQATGHAAGREVRPAPGETWRAKTSRTRRAFRNAFTSRHEHDREWARQSDARRE